MKRILIVDDEPDLRELLEYHFKHAGFSVLTAADGLEALEKVRLNLPDCILLDLLLPDLDGFTLCEILRRHPSTAPLPILFLTAVGGQISRLVGLDAGADDHLVKPVSPSVVLQRVNEFLTQARTLGQRTTRSRQSEAGGPQPTAPANEAVNR
jgi:DNA-binding response OmpR family regulator